MSSVVKQPAAAHSVQPSKSLCLRTGDLVYRIETDLPELLTAITTVYRDFDLTTKDFADFHLSASRLSRWKNPFSRDAVIEMIGGFRSPVFSASQVMAHFEWSLNRCVFSCFFHRLILHAGVLERGGRAVILVGESGAGKSTLTAALALNGWRLLSDELTILSTHDGSLTGLARPIALKNDSIDLIKSLSPHARFGPTSFDTPKGDVAHLAPPTDSVRRVHESATPSSFVFVDFEPGRELEIEPVPRTRAFMMVAEDAAINYAALGAAGFTTLANAIESADCYILHYSRLQDAIAFFASDEWTSRR
ncbi:MAG: HprK-related kinase A [Gammaproteobacteria bacterium]